MRKENKKNLSLLLSFLTLSKRVQERDEWNNKEEANGGKKTFYKY